jgi:hypothetical protein
VVLHNNGRNLTAKEWRTFQLQFEIAAERVEDKGEREEYEMLYNQLSAHWQEKVVKEEKHRSENQNWVRVAALGNLRRGDFMQLFEEEGIEYTDIKEKGNGYLVKLRNEWETQKMLELSGEIVGRCTLRVTRTDIHLSTRAIFKLVGDYLRVKEEAVSRRKGMGDMHRRVNSTEVEGEVKPKVIFAEEKGKEVIKPKENIVTQFKPQSGPIIPKGIPAPRAWESHPNAWNNAPGVAPPLRGSWATAPPTWSTTADAGTHDWTGPTSSWQAGPPNPQSNPQWISGPSPPGQWSSHPAQGKGTGKGMSYANTSKGKGMTSGKGLSSGKGSSTGKGGVQMLTSDQKAPPLVNTSGRKCGYCHSQGRDGNHDFLTCNFRNEDREPNHTE